MHTFVQKSKATQLSTPTKFPIPGRSYSRQSAEARSILQLQRTLGNKAAQRMLQAGIQEPEVGLSEPAAPRSHHDFSWIPIAPPSAAIPTALAITRPGDGDEQEADSLADQVMRTTELHLQRACLCGGGCPKCQSKWPRPEHQSLRTTRGHASDLEQVAAPPVVHEVLRSPGQALGAVTRAFMEPRFGRDFSRVRVHTDAAAEQSAKDVNARAYTVGHDVVFGAAQFAPETVAGRRLIAHELAHVAQQSATHSVMHLQRQAVKPDMKPIPALQPLEVVARDVAELILRNYAADNMAAGPVLTAVLDEVTHKIYIGLNSGIPPKVVDVVRAGMQAQKDRIQAKQVIVIRTDPMAQGGHSETNAVNEAVRAREILLKREVTEADLRTFTLHNVWLKGADRKFTAAPRCEHCARITRSVSVTSSVFFAEGGVSGTIRPSSVRSQRVPPRVGPGGATGSISGEITVPDKVAKAPLPASTTPDQSTHEQPNTSTKGPKAQPSTEGTMDVQGPGRISPTSVAPAVDAAANLLSVIFAPYLFPDAQANYRERLHELQTNLQPSVQARIDELLRTETPRIAQLGSGGEPLYITVKLTVWTQQSDVVGVPADLVNLLLDEVTLGTKNINKNEHSHSLADTIRCGEVGHCRSYQLYSIPVPAAIQQEAVRRLRSVSGWDLKSFNQLADNLKDSSVKVRMSAAIGLARLTKDIGSLRGPAIQQFIPVLGDDDERLRAIAAVALRALDATEAIPSIRQALAKTRDEHMKAAIQAALDRLDEIHHGTK